ncbi:hypothetical protein [Burkholderia anthina]|uniref:hypothetical protein n=1 Tax=Burkholderia anthina TaxID=179879 RepID=UPI001FC8D6BC|nr:hypothetical protein [Burkholderia anthina]
MLPIDVALIAESDGVLDAAAAPSSCARARPDAPNTQMTASAALHMLFIVAPHMKKRCNNNDADPHRPRMSTRRMRAAAFVALTCIVTRDVPASAADRPAPATPACVMSILPRQFPNVSGD